MTRAFTYGKPMIKQLQEWTAERRLRIACGGVRVLQDVRRDLLARRTSGELDATLYANNLDFFRYENSADSIRDAKAVILVAVPRAAHRLLFELEDGLLDVILPPTYLRYSAVFNEIRDDITAAIPELHGHLEILVAPLKSVACRLGLVVYGRNNLAYIPEWGSYFQLVGYITDHDVGVGHDWSAEPLRLMSECDGCGLCSAACPTGAIGEGRILLHAESCTTLFSEQAGDLSNALSANCLFGCLECQRICPANSGLLRIESAGVTFDRYETEAILGEHHEKLGKAPNVLQKLSSLGLTEETLVARNLAYLIQRKQAAPGATKAGSR